MPGQVTGRAMVRPVRLGMVFEPSIDVLHRAVSEATLLWGGVYQPIFNGSNPEQVKRSASGLGVDVLWALDHTSSSKQVAKLVGYQWHGDNEWSPLAPAKDYMSPRLLGPERMLHAASDVNWVLPIWESSDPLDDLYRIWFGTYDESPQGTSLKQDFAARSTIVRLDSAALPVGAATWATPILVTANAIEYTGESFGPAFVVVNPSDPESLIAFWNLRAYGANVFPWPENHEERLAGAARQWLSQLLEKDELNRWRSGDGKPLPPQIEVWMPVSLPGQPQNWETWIPPVPPKLLTDLLASVGVNPMINSIDGAEQRIHGWRGSHPFNTNFIHRFSEPTESERRVNIPVPRIDGTKEARGRVRGDTVAVQLEIDGTSGIRPDYTFNVPNVRRLAAFLGDFDGPLLHFDRPAADGRALSLSSGAQAFAISAVPTISIFDKLIEAPGWVSHRTPSGTFLTRLIDRLGGPSSNIANQPGARAALIEVARSQQGAPSGAVVEYVRKYRGDWPDKFASEERISAYPGQVFRFLLAIGILRPVFPVTCPHCTTSIAIRPEDLVSQMKCELCLEEFPLGLALGSKVGRGTDWLYRLAGHVDQFRLRETLPVMATLQVLTSRGYLSPSTVPYVLGWKVNGPGLDCEIDIAAVIDERGLPIVIIGEAKHHMRSIDANDLDNLRLVQNHFRSMGIECFILVAVMRDLRQEEIDLLRDFSSRTPRTLQYESSIEPVLPIIFAEKDLSVTPFGEQPMRWAAGRGIVGLARQSCMRNLGMTSIDFSDDGNGFFFSPRWS